MIGQIEIGGAIKPNHVDGLCVALSIYAGEFIPADLETVCTQEGNFDCENGWSYQGGILRVYNAKVSGGFAALERVCVEYGIAFERTCEGKSDEFMGPDYPPEKVFHRPDCAEIWERLRQDHGLTSPGVYIIYLDNDGHHVIEVATVRKYLKSILDYFANFGCAERGNMESVLGLPEARIGAICIKAIIGPEFPPLPPIEIVE